MELNLFRMLIFVALLACPAVALSGVAPEGTQSSAGAGKPHQRMVPPDAGGWQRDPFQRGGAKPAQTGKSQGAPIKAAIRPALPQAQPKDVSLQGIMQVDKKYFALINGRVVKAGDKLDGLVVEAVSRFGIVVRDESGRRRLDVYGGELPKGGK